MIKIAINSQKLEGGKVKLGIMRIEKMEEEKRE